MRERSERLTIKVVSILALVAMAIVFAIGLASSAQAESVESKVDAYSDSGMTPDGDICNITKVICGDFRNGGSKGIRITCSWPVKPTTKTYVVSSGQKTTKYCKDTDGFHVSSGHKIQRQHCNRGGCRYEDFVTTAGWYKILDYFGGTLRKVNK